MEEFAIGLGVLLAILGPLLILPLVWLVYRLAALPLARRWLGSRLERQALRLVAATVSTVIVSVALLASYLPGKVEHDRLCALHAEPSVARRVIVDGFFRTRLYPYEARRYLGDGGFTFVEAPHLYKGGVYVRYTQAQDGEIRQQELFRPTSRYGVRETFSQEPQGITLTEKEVYELASGKELARAAHITFSGGPLSLFLGAYAMSSCPDISTAEGSRNFRIFYDLEKIVLGGAAVE